MITVNLNINFLSSKFDENSNFWKFDILIITDIELDDTYPISQFHIEGYSIMFRLDTNRNSTGVIIYISQKG